MSCRNSTTCNYGGLIGGQNDEDLHLKRQFGPIELFPHPHSIWYLPVRFLTHQHDSAKVAEIVSPSKDIFALRFDDRWSIGVNHKNISDREHTFTGRNGLFGQPEFFAVLGWMTSSKTIVLGLQKYHQVPQAEERVVFIFKDHGLAQPSFLGRIFL